MLTPDISSNSLGRTYCLWLLMQANGWSVEVFAPLGAELWMPLRGTEFATICSTVAEDDPRLREAVSAADLVVAVKPVDASFGRATRLVARVHKPLLLDVDDPDLEAALSWRRPVRRFVKGVVKFRSVRQNVALKNMALQATTIVSNPVLQTIYGGEIVPHVRADLGPGSVHSSRTPNVAFVGTNRKHKGVDVLRAAVATRQSEGVTLTLTDTPPADARPWENWIGTTTLEHGLQVVAEADIVVIPSRVDGYSRGQLPAKIIDAMLSGRAIVVSDIEPMPWAVADAGVVVEPSSVAALASALHRLADPDLRHRLGSAARERALMLFTVDANRDAFRHICERTVAAFARSQGSR
ncbi:glycosyltransferase family 4 protein [Plantibacter flavus]|uniref:glycosyltransferase family 4 protein n=1 Tax=Plantibacter flavus TaxID=150123 RepID=UPI003F147038